MVSNSQVTGGDGDTYLWDVGWWVETDGSRLVLELVTVQIEEVHQKIAVVVLAILAPALDARHVLQHADDQADNGEATDAAVDGLVEAAHGEEVLDEGDEDGHFRVLLSPMEEGLDSVKASEVFEGHVDFEASARVNELDQGDPRFANDLDVVERSHPGVDQGLSQAIEHVPRCIHWKTALHHRVRAEHQVHVAGG